MSVPLPVADPWFTCTEVERGVLQFTEPHVARLWRANVFFILGRDRHLLVDSGMGVGDLRAALARWLDRPVVLATTHNHIDHVGGHWQFQDAEILVHPAEADGLRSPVAPRGLRYDDFDPITRASFQAAGFATDGLFIDALPHPGFDPITHRYAGVEPSRLVDEGDVIDLGDRRFAVLHLPGHSPGSIGLWEEASGTLVAGDAVYDGILVDTMPCSHIPSYIATMERLRALPARIVHGGHRSSFGRDRMTAIIDDYLTTRRGGPRPEVERAAITF